MKNLLLALCACCFFLACDQVVGGVGFVYDANTRLPIANVKIEDSRSDTIEILSDSTGYFDTTTLQNCGCNECAASTLSFSKDGYHTLTATEPDFDTLFLQPK